MSDLVHDCMQSTPLLRRADPGFQWHFRMGRLLAEWAWSATDGDPDVDDPDLVDELENAIRATMRANLEPIGAGPADYAAGEAAVMAAFDVAKWRRPCRTRDALKGNVAFGR